ncbi:uncharacterized protein LOC142349815 [Convolutriloba macropyga]|uniref:uncharacterized protein LOC142349815 n=1 Tax=Convolutriloba macropyga TaxID=536237 RepID=UPI003F527C22
MSLDSDFHFEHITVTSSEVRLTSKLVVQINRILYVIHEDRTVVSLSYYDSNSAKIKTEFVKFKDASKAVGLLEHFSSILSKRKTKNRMFAFVNPASGMSKGVEIFQNSVLPHLENAGISVDHKVTEKEGEQSLENIAKRIDTSRYDALIVVGGDSSLRDVINGLWEKAGKPEVDQFHLPLFAMVPGGTGNVLARKWYGAFGVDAAVSAIILGDTRTVQLFRVSSLESREGLDMVGITCVAYGVTIETLKLIRDKNYPLPIKMLYGFGNSVINHAEPFRAEIEMNHGTGDDASEQNRDVVLRDLMVLSTDMSMDTSPVGSTLGSFVCIEAKSGKFGFLRAFSNFARRMQERKRPVQPGVSKDGLIEYFANMVDRLTIKIPDSENQKEFKNFINVDGNLYDCEPNFHVQFYHNKLPCFVIDQD